MATYTVVPGRCLCWLPELKVARAICFPGAKRASRFNGCRSRPADFLRVSTVFEVRPHSSLFYGGLTHEITWACRIRHFFWLRRGRVATCSKSLGVGRTALCLGGAGVGGLLPDRFCLCFYKIQSPLRFADAMNALTTLGLAPSAGLSKS